MRLIHILGDSHQGRHGSEGYALEVHVESGTYDADATGRELLAYVHDTHVEELGLVDTHYVNIIGQQQNLLRRVNRR